MNGFRRGVIPLMLVMLLALSGCGFLYQGEGVSSGSAQSTLSQPVKRATPVPGTAATPKPQSKNVNLLTGIADLSDAAVGKRPAAVMVNNIFDSLPQYGISEADMVFELPVESDITRLMALYGDYNKVPKVCSVRSCRYYFPILAAGYDAYYVHWGQDETIAADVLNALDIDTLDGMDDTYGLFGRDEERRQEGFAYEHTGVFDGTALPKQLKENGVRTDLPVNKNEPFFEFKERASAPEGQDCGKLTVNFSSTYFSTFIYNSKSHLYYKEHSGKDHRDQKTGKQLAFTNVFILETDISTRDEVGRKDINWSGGREYGGYYVSEGKMCRISWEKKDEYADLIFTTEDGARLKVNSGKSYVGFTAPGTVSLGE